MAGTVSLKAGTAHVLFDLRQGKVPGSDLRRSALGITYAGKPYRVLYALFLLQEKVGLALRVEQRGRNDIHHVKLSNP